MNQEGSYCNTEAIVADKEILSVKEIERSLHKNFRKDIWRPFVEAIQTYQLIEEGDKIGVAVSGGKDSLIMAKLFQLLQRTKIVNFEVEFISMDPGFNKINRKLLEDNLALLGIPTVIYESQIFGVVDKIARDYPCYLCAKMRRGSLYAKAQELGCNKLALGHHLDDVVETILLNIFYAGKFETMLPKLDAMNYEGMQLIRPLYLVEEKNIIRFTKYVGLSPMNCGCVVAAKKTSSKRREMKELIETMSKTNKDVKKSILSSSKHVNLSKILGYKSSDGEDVAK